MNLSWTKTMALLGIMALTAVGCAKSTTAGSGGSQSPSPSSSAPVSLSGTVTDKGTKDLTGQGKTIDFSLEADDEDDLTTFYFKPTFIKVTPDGKVTVEVENEGSVEHNFSITSLGIDQNVKQGEKKEVTFTLPSSGVVNFFCKFHVGSGMQGAFFFAPGGAATTTSTSGTSGYGY